MSEDKTAEIRWTPEAARRVENAPAFVRPGIKKLMVLRARERGYTVITSELLTEIRNESMRRAAERIKGMGFEELRMEAFEQAKQKMGARRAEVIEQIQAFLAQRTGKNMQIIDKFKQYLQGSPEEEEGEALRWTPEALARLERIPSFVRGMAQKAIEEQARKRGMKEVTAELMAEVGSQMMPAAARQALGLSREAQEAQEVQLPSPQTELPTPEASRVWTPEALERLDQVPEGLLREIVRERIELYAQKKGADRVTVELMEAKYGEWRERGAHWERELAWSPEAEERVDRAPKFVRGIIIRELEQYAREQGRPEVTLELIEEARATRWQARQMYHAQS